MDFDEEWFISDKEDALNALDRKEVEVKALENGEDEEQVDQGQELFILTTTIRRLKPIAIVNKDTITIAALIQTWYFAKAWVTQTCTAIISIAHERILLKF